MFNSIKGQLKKNKIIMNLFLYKRLFKYKIDINNPDFIARLQKGNGEILNKKPIVKIEISNESGFFALFLAALNTSYYYYMYGFVPYIVFTNKTGYYDINYSKNIKNENAFEYFFSQKLFEKNSINDYINVYSAFNLNAYHLNEKHRIKNQYEIIDNDSLLLELSKIYNKLFTLNQVTRNLISECQRSLSLSNEFIGVHFRGTDFRYELKGHPKFISEEDYFREIDCILSERNDLDLFLATDDKNSLKKFISKYGDRVKFYQDVDRSETKSLGYYSENSRDFHGYKSGYEILRDVFTLTNSSYFICGASNVSIAAKIFNIAEGKCFKETRVLDNGISAHGKQLLEVDKNFKRLVRNK